MADPLSIAASALAVAGAGGKLAQTLYIFIESVRKGEKQLRPVADHVKLTSVVLDNIGTLLGDQDVRSLCKDSLLGTTNDALEGCRKAFDELRKYVDELLKQDGNGKTKLSAFDKLTFLPFRQRELNELQANLERFKGALDLILGVLNLSVSIKNNKDSSEIQQLKAQVERLIQAKRDAEQALQASSNLSSSQPGVGANVPKTDQRAPHSAAGASPANPQGLATTARSLTAMNSTKASSINASAAPAASSFMVMTARSIPEPSTSDDVDAQQPVARALPSEESKALEQASEAPGGRPKMPLKQDDPYGSDSDSDNEDELLQHLGKCAEAVAELSTMIEQATERWQNQRHYRKHGLTPAFQATHKAMKKLWAYEIDLDLSDGDESATSGKSPVKELAGHKKTSGVLKSAKASHSAPIDTSSNVSGRNRKEYALTRRRSRSRSRAGVDLAGRFLDPPSSAPERPDRGADAFMAPGTVDIAQNDDAPGTVITEKSRANSWNRLDSPSRHHLEDHDDLRPESQQRGLTLTTPSGRPGADSSSGKSTSFVRPPPGRPATMIADSVETSTGGRPGYSFAQQVEKARNLSLNDVSTPVGGRDDSFLSGRQDYPAQSEQASSKLLLPSASVTDTQTRTEKRRRPIPEREVTETPRYLRRFTDREEEARVGAEMSSERPSDQTNIMSRENSQPIDIAIGRRESMSSPKTALPPAIDRERMSVDERIALLRKSIESDGVVPADDGTADECKDDVKRTSASLIELNQNPYVSSRAGDLQNEESDRRASSRPRPAGLSTRTSSGAGRNLMTATSRILSDGSDLGLLDDRSLYEENSDSGLRGVLEGLEAQEVDIPSSSQGYQMPSLNEASTKPVLDAPEKFSAVDDLLREWTVLDV